MSAPLELSDADELVDQVIARVGRRLVVGAPLGLGKANRILGALYERARSEPDLDLVVHTALGLVPPESASALEARLRGPMNERLFGRCDVPRLFVDFHRDALPPNVTGIDRVNTLDDDAEQRRAQRVRARFINTALTVALDGSAASDTLPDGRVLSGVGGQFDFVEMSRRLPGARSVMLVRAVHDKGHSRSNIVIDHPYVTCPAHLRDLVVTEYGVADLRDQPDGVVAARLIEIADSRFQDDLVQRAVAAGRLDRRYRVPGHRRRNTPSELERRWAPLSRLRPEFPFDSELTDAAPVRRPFPAPPADSVPDRRHRQDPHD